MAAVGPFSREDFRTCRNSGVIAFGLMASFGAEVVWASDANGNVNRNTAFAIVVIPFIGSLLAYYCCRPASNAFAILMGASVGVVTPLLTERSVVAFSAASVVSGAAAASIALLQLRTPFG